MTAPPAAPGEVRRGVDLRGRAGDARSHLRQPLFRNAYALMLSTVVSGALGFGFWAMAARRYSTEVVGQNAALLAAMMTLSTFAQLDLARMVLRFLPRWRETVGRSIVLAYSAATATAVVLSVGFVLVAPRVSDNFSFLRSGAIPVGFCLAVLAWGVFAIQDGVLTGLGRAVVVPIENTSFVLGKLVLLVAFSALLPAWGIFSAWVIPVAISLVPINYLIFRRYLPRHRKLAPHPEVLDRTAVVRYVAYDYAGGLCGALSTMALPLILTVFLGASESALFYVAWTIVLVFDAVALSLGSSLIVEGSFQPDQLEVYARRVARRGALILLPTIGALVVLAPLILSVYGPEYSQDSTPVLRLLAIGLIPRSVIIMFGSIARVRGEMRFALMVDIVSTSLILVLVCLGANSIGLTGVALGWVVGYTIPAIALVPVIRRMLRDRWAT